MSTGSLVWAEIIHRKLTFALALLAVVLAVACSVAVITLIRSQEVRTARRVAALDDQIRKITKNMGYNITILPKDLNLVKYHALDFGEKTMPMEYVTRLAESRSIMTINHLRPALIRKIMWPEKNRQILIMAVSGVVPFAHRDPKKPLSQPVPKGQMVLGSVLATELDLKVGDRVEFHGRPFRIGQVNTPRGTQDDITVWIDLETLQDILDMRGRINMIQALECNCASADPLTDIKAEIFRLLGDDVQVIELASKAIARAKARQRVKAAGAASVARLERLASLLLPLVVVGAALLVGFLFLANVRERRLEIGILRAVGTGSRQVFTLFLFKAFVLGLAGAILGYACGFMATARLETTAPAGTAAGVTMTDLFQPQLLVWSLILAPVLAMLVSWLPALAAVRQDPAVVLREE